MTHTRLTSEFHVPRRLCLLTLLAIAAAIAVQPAFAQGNWSGQLKCQLNLQSSEYAHQEIQTWTITGPPPVSNPGSFQDYPATWTATGQGGLQRTQNLQTLAARWNTNVPAMNTFISIFVSTWNDRLLINSRHSQLVVPAGTIGLRQVSVPGSQPSQVQLAAYEWPFPAIEDVATSTNVTGTRTIVIPGAIMPLQSPSISSTASCRWQFTKGTGAPSQRTPLMAQNGGSPMAMNGAQPNPIASATSGAAGVGAVGGGTAIGNVGTTPGEAILADKQGVLSGNPQPGFNTLNSGGSGTQQIATIQNKPKPVAQYGTSNTPISQRCQDPGMLQGSGSPGNPAILGSIQPGQASSSSGSLSSAADRKFYQITVPAGVDANVSLSGMQSGADFDLYAYHSDLTPIDCSLTRGAGQENIKTQFGDTQSSNVVLVEVSSYSWNANSPTYSLTVNGLTTASGSQLPSNVQNRPSLDAQRGIANAAVSPACNDPGISQGSGNPGNPTILGSIQPGQSSSSSGSLSSATDRKFYQITVGAGVNVSISLSEMQSDADFDLYAYHSDLSPIGCSTTRGPAPENITTQIGGSQSSNTVIVEVVPYTWSASSATYRLTVNGTASPSSSIIPSTVTSLDSATVTLPDAAAQPNNVMQGAQNVSINVYGKRLNFIPGATIDFGPGITTVSLAVKSQYSAMAVINVDPNAQAGNIGFTLVLRQNGSVSRSYFSNTFTVTAVPNAAAEPSNVMQGQQNVSVKVYGKQVNFSPGATLDFGPGITTTSMTVESATSATALINVDWNAQVGNIGFTLVTSKNGSVARMYFPALFTITAAPNVILAPGGGQQGQQNLSVNVYGRSVSFGTATMIDFGPGVKVLSTTMTSAHSGTAVINIHPTADLGPHYVTLVTESNGSTSTQNLNASFNVVAPMTVIPIAPTTPTLVSN